MDVDASKFVAILPKKELSTLTLISYVKLPLVRLHMHSDIVGDSGHVLMTVGFMMLLAAA